MFGWAFSQRSNDPNAHLQVNQLFTTELNQPQQSICCFRQSRIAERRTITNHLYPGAAHPSWGNDDATSETPTGGRDAVGKSISTFRVENSKWPRVYEGYRDAGAALKNVSGSPSRGCLAPAAGRQTTSSMLYTSSGVSLCEKFANLALVAAEIPSCMPARNFAYALEASSNTVPAAPVAAAAACEGGGESEGRRRPREV